ncbi:hypothetical protein K488DRAFT_84989 [Vararia minispora EC-137]|uniref:Uncharacterized protein n=1 Tax=Vararia minispora EC-137 TaxID=1314806 RepID=A0ACB8QPG5_9AGAM|nr:hypothetical protein K488DRAFT_84989 [Vararia minispora EC-137]
MRALVYVIFMIETAQMGIVGHDTCMILASGWGNSSLLFNQELQWLSSPLVDGLTAGYSQLFYVWRIFVLSRSRVLSGVIGALSLGTAAAGFTAGVRSKIVVKGDATKIQDANYPFVTYMRAQATVMFKATNDLITRMIRLIVVFSPFNGEFLFSFYAKS